MTHKERIEELERRVRNLEAMGAPAVDPQRVTAPLPKPVEVPWQSPWPPYLGDGNQTASICGSPIGTIRRG